MTVSKQDIAKAKEDYANECLKSAFEYESDVLEGKIIASEWIKKAVIRERELRAKYTYDEAKVKEVFKFFYFVNIQPKTRFKPLPFQAWIVLCIYGLYKENGKRLRKYGIIWVARKNGKTAFTSLLSLYEFIKGSTEAEAYFLATTARQASQALKYLKAMISYSPALKKRVDVLAYHLRFKKHSILKPLANNPSKLDGLNPSFAIIDELQILEAFGHPFRKHPDGHSGMIRTPIPETFGHLFRDYPDSDSGNIRTLN